MRANVSRLSSYFHRSVLARNFPVQTGRAHRLGCVLDANIFIHAPLAKQRFHSIACMNRERLREVSVYQPKEVMPQPKQTINGGASTQVTSFTPKSTKTKGSREEHGTRVNSVQQTRPLEDSRHAVDRQLHDNGAQTDSPRAQGLARASTMAYKNVVDKVKQSSGSPGDTNQSKSVRTDGKKTPIRKSTKSTRQTKDGRAKLRARTQDALIEGIVHAPEADAKSVTTRKEINAAEEVDSLLLDADYIRANMPYPAPNQYPDAPCELFNDDLSTVGHELHNNYLRFGSSDQVKTSFKHLPPTVRKTKRSNHVEGKWCCNLNVDIPGLGAREVASEGKSKKSAKNSAWVHLVSLLHTNGELSQLFQRVNPSTQHSSAPMNARIEPRLAKIESDGIVEIYNYAARYALVPGYKVSLLGRRQKRSLIQVSITLAQWHIKATGTALDITTAEASAVLDFKAQAERFHQLHDLLPSDRYVITTQNAKQFLDLYKSRYPLMNTSIENNAVELKGTRWQAQMYLNGNPIGQAIPRRLKDQAIELVHLTAALHVAHQEPDLLTTFAQTVRKDRRPELPVIRPIRTPIEYHSELVMMASLRTLANSGLPDETQTLTAEVDYDVQHFRRKRRLEGRAVRHRNAELVKSLATLREDEARSESQAKLPMNSYRAEVHDMVTKNLYSIVVGATGSGKTTQVPQILLDDAIHRNEGAHCNIICTQPRRIAATSVARRVAAERGEQIGDSVGYHVRFEARHPKNGGSILYCTTGILLEQLKHSPDEVMDNASHIVVDEVHERDMLIDFLMINLRNILQIRQDKRKRVPRIVLMSATMDTELFANYFGKPDPSGSRIPCPSISVPGRTYPVKEYFLEDILRSIGQTYASKTDNMLYPTKASKGTSLMAKYLEDEWAIATTETASNVEEQSQNSFKINWKMDPASEGEPLLDEATSEQRESFVPLDLVAATVGHICKSSEDGAILVFLPGLDEILKTNSALIERPIYGCSFEDPSKFKIHMLHSTVPHEAQQEVFAVVPEGCRKIILSTNIAETSVTIPDVRYVVDTGKLRETRYDQVKRITRLQTVWASKSNVRQRAGRAGRVQDGYYFGLFSKGRHESLKSTGLPELLRSDLQETCLAVKAQRFTEPIQQFLSQAIEPPPSIAVQTAVAELKALEAFTSDERLTDLGRILSKMPVHPSLGKMIIFGIIFRCLDPMLLLGAAAEERSIFARPMGERLQANEARKSFSGYGSDHISFLAAFDGMRQVRNNYGISALWTHARTKYLHVGAFNTVEKCAQQIESVLADAGLVPGRVSRMGSEHRNAYVDGIGGAELNVNSGNQALVRALLVAGLHPNLVTKPSSSGTAFRAPNEHTVFLHPSSLNHAKKGSAYPSGTLFAYSSLAKSPDGKMLFFRESTKVTPLVAMLFGGHLRLDRDILVMDDWLSFSIESDDSFQSARLILEFRKALDRLLRTAFRSITNRREDSTQPYLANIPLIDKAARDVAELLELENELKQFIRRA